MDNNEFLNSFMDVDILKAEGVAEVCGRVVAKLCVGMVAGGMEPEAVNALLGSTFEILLNYFAKLGGYQQ